jgi:hypothetical protein
MPNFVYRAFMKTEEVYSFNFYLPCKIKDNDVEFEIKTDYPFKEEVVIIYHGEKKHLNLRFRKPKWCKEFEFICEKKALYDNDWIKIEGVFEKNEKIILKIKTSLEVLNTEEGYLIQKNPLVYTLQIKPKITIDKNEKRQAKGYPAYDIYPISTWQIALNKEDFIKHAKLCYKKNKSLLSTKTTIKSTGYILHGVGLKYVHTSNIPISDYDKQEIVKLKGMGQVIYEGDIAFTPEISDIQYSTVTKTKICLAPYCSAMLRWTIFPKVDDK